MRAIAFALLALTSVFTAPALASGPLPIIARVDKVRIEVGKDGATVVVDGRFLTRAQDRRSVINVGRIHYSCPDKSFATCMLAWNDLAKAAHKAGNCVSWGQPGEKLPAVVTPGVQLPEPTPWQPGIGIATLGDARCAELDPPKTPN